MKKESETPILRLFLFMHLKHKYYVQGPLVARMPYALRDIDLQTGAKCEWDTAIVKEKRPRHLFCVFGGPSYFLSGGKVAAQRLPGRSLSLGAGRATDGRNGYRAFAL